MSIVNPEDLVVGKTYIIRSKPEIEYPNNYTYIGTYEEYADSGGYRFLMKDKHGERWVFGSSNTEFVEYNPSEMPPGAGANGGRKSRKQKLKKRRRVTRKKPSVFSK